MFKITLVFWFYFPELLEDLNDNITNYVNILQSTRADMKW